MKPLLLLLLAACAAAPTPDVPNDAEALEDGGCVSPGQQYHHWVSGANTYCTCLFAVPEPMWKCRSEKVAQ